MLKILIKYLFALCFFSSIQLGSLHAEVLGDLTIESVSVESGINHIHQVFYSLGNRKDAHSYHRPKTDRDEDFLAELTEKEIEEDESEHSKKHFEVSIFIESIDDKALYFYNLLKSEKGLPFCKQYAHFSSYWTLHILKSVFLI